MTCFCALVRSVEDLEDAEGVFAGGDAGAGGEGGADESVEHLEAVRAAVSLAGLDPVAALSLRGGDPVRMGGLDAHALVGPAGGPAEVALQAARREVHV